jgi:hypothetical protein
MTRRTPAALMAVLAAVLAVLVVGCGVSSEDEPHPIGDTPVLSSPDTPTSTVSTVPTISSVSSPAPSSPPVSLR